MPEPNKNQERAKNNITSDHVISINKYKKKKIQTIGSFGIGNKPV
jgi:hypothetical protein